MKSCDLAFRLIAWLLLAVSHGLFAVDASAQIVSQFPPRTVVHQAGKIGGAGGYMKIFQISPTDQYYLDYTLVFRPGFDWVPNGRPRGGKLPGLAGGRGTGGCRDVEPTGWSARQTWGADGVASLYLYHQGRRNRCGDKYWFKTGNGQTFRFITGRQYRITQRVSVNSPGASNGEVQIWIDGDQVLSENNLQLRGNVPESEGRVSQVKYHSYFGGDNLKFAPANDSYIDYGAMYVMTCMPNLAAQPGQCQ